MKRLATLASQVQPHYAMGVLALIRQLLTRYPKAKRLLDIDSACVGVFNPEVPATSLLPCGLVLCVR